VVVRVRPLLAEEEDSQELKQTNCLRVKEQNNEIE
jgi:hypothetical protein